MYLQCSTNKVCEWKLGELGWRIDQDLVGISFVTK